VARVLEKAPEGWQNLNLGGGRKRINLNISRLSGFE